MADMGTREYPLLDQVRDPVQLRQLDEAELPQLAADLRNFLIDSVASSWES